MWRWRCWRDCLIEGHGRNAIVVGVFAVADLAAWLVLVLLFVHVCLVEDLELLLILIKVLWRRLDTLFLHDALTLRGWVILLLLIRGGLVFFARRRHNNDRRRLDRLLIRLTGLWLLLLLDRRRRLLMHRLLVGLDTYWIVEISSIAVFRWLYALLRLVLVLLLGLFLLGRARHISRLEVLILLLASLALLGGPWGHECRSGLLLVLGFGLYDLRSVRINVDAVVSDLLFFVLLV